MYSSSSACSAASGSAPGAHSGPLQRAVDGGDGEVELLRGLLRGQPDDVAEDQHGARPRRHVLDRDEVGELDGLLRDQLLVRAGRGVEQRVRIRLEPRDLVVRRGGQRPGPARDRVQAGVRGDSVEPGAERRAARVRRALAPRTQERLLHQVLGVLEGGEHAVAVELQLVAVAFRERGERVAVRRREGVGLRAHTCLTAAGSGTHRR
jgi:hypothetical protein